MENTSGLKPKGFAVLLQPYEAEMKTKGGIVIPDNLKGKLEINDQRAVVVEVGTCCWNDEPEPRAKTGDKVMIGKFAGYMITGPNDGKQYRMVLDRDIFCQITQENTEVEISYV